MLMKTSSITALTVALQSLATALGDILDNIPPETPTKSRDEEDEAPKGRRSRSTKPADEDDEDIAISRAKARSKADDDDADEPKARRRSRDDDDDADEPKTRRRSRDDDDDADEPKARRRSRDDDDDADADDEPKARRSRSTKPADEDEDEILDELQRLGNLMVRHRLRDELKDILDGAKARSITGVAAKRRKEVIEDLKDALDKADVDFEGGKD